MDRPGIYFLELLSADQNSVEYFNLANVQSVRMSRQSANDNTGRDRYAIPVAVTLTSGRAIETNTPGNPSLDAELLLTVFQDALVWYDADNEMPHRP